MLYKTLNALSKQVIFCKNTYFFLFLVIFSFILFANLLILHPQIKIKREMLKKILVVIIKPKLGWQYIDDSGNSTQRVLSSVFFPLLAILAISSFIPMIYDSTITLSDTLMKAIVSFSGYMLTYFLCSYLLSGFYPEFSRSHIALAKLNNYLIYNLSFMIILQVLMNVLNAEFSVLYFMFLYMPYMAFNALDFLGLKSGKRVKFFIISVLMMMVLPFLIILILNSLIKK